MKGLGCLGWKGEPERYLCPLRNYLKRSLELSGDTRAERKPFAGVPDSFLPSFRNGSTNRDTWITMLTFFPRPTGELDTFFTLAQLLFANPANMPGIVMF